MSKGHCKEFRQRFRGSPSPVPIAARGDTRLEVPRNASGHHPRRTHAVSMLELDLRAVMQRLRMGERLPIVVDRSARNAGPIADVISLGARLGAGNVGEQREVRFSIWSLAWRRRGGVCGDCLASPLAGCVPAYGPSQKRRLASFPSASDELRSSQANSKQGAAK